jgi:hypothetical protein
MPFIALPDSHFVMGASHRICEDYTLHGKTDNLVWYIVCDGCSSSVNTDVGARLLAHILGKNITEIYNAQNREQTIIGYAKEVEGMLVNMGLNSQSLMVTLHIGITDGSNMTILSMGDGFDWYYTGQRLVVMNRNYYNLPYYVGYRLNESDNTHYISEGGGFCIPTTIINTDITREKESHEPVFLVEYTLPIHDIISFGSCTDGIDSFIVMFADAKNISSYSVVEQLTQIASPTKGFITRRLIRILDGLNKKGLKPNDDIGVGAIYVVEHEISSAESGNS